MKTILYTTVLALALGLQSLAPALAAPAAAKHDWVTDGYDNQRSGWNRLDTTITRANASQLKLKWVLQTDNAPRALHSLMPALVIGALQTPAGVKEVTIVSGISDNLYAIDSATGELLWRRSWGYNVTSIAPGAGGPAIEVAPLPGGPVIGNQPAPSLNFLGPGGSSDVPVIGPADAQGRRPIYFVTGDGVLNTINAATGEDMAAPWLFQTGKGWSLNLIGDVLAMQSGSSVAMTRLSDPQHNVYRWSSGSGGMWGRRGLAIDSTGSAWGTTGDGTYNPAANQYANSVVSVQLGANGLTLRNWYTPSNWAWLLKRDLDPNNTPTIFNFKGREVVAASGKECRLYLLDAKEPGGAGNQTPLVRTPLFCNDEVDFQDRGSWGALSSWEDNAGTRWVLAPFWGPASVETKFPIVNTPATKLGGVAAFKVTGTADKPQLVPAWVSRDMNHGEPVAIANGLIFGYGSGETTRQSWTDRGLSFDSTLRGNIDVDHAVIYVLDGQTGREIWNSGDIIKTWNHFSGITVANGKIYLATYDGKIYCFGL